LKTNSKSVGEKSEAVILAHLVQQGLAVSLPFGNNQRYDMIVEECGKLLRVQCKTGKLKNGCVHFWTCSTNGFTSKKKSYTGEVDLFIVYCPDNGKFYRIPVESSAKFSCSLRISPPACKQKCQFKWARDFEF
jgi:hypothetical protein